MLAVPALAAFTLAVLAGPVFRTARVTSSLITRWAGPAFLTAAGAPHANTVRAAVHRTYLCIARKRNPGKRQKEQVEGEREDYEGPRLTFV